MAATPTPQPTTLPGTPEPPRTPAPGGGRARALVLGALGLAVLVVAVLGWMALSTGPDTPDGQSRAARFTVPALDVAPGSGVPTGATAPTADVAAWARGLAERSDIPARTLVAYATAEQQTRARTPGCNLSWTTLAGVGRIESHHGRYGGTTVGEDGRLSKPIIGVPLDGSPGVQAIRDTDGGSLDGDAQWDRAVGSMQFLPATWDRWSVRASGDGARPDPQNVDDAALTAARYLCASGGDLATDRGWWGAVLTYNESIRYGRDVFSGADAYGRL